MLSTPPEIKFTDGKPSFWTVPEVHYRGRVYTVDLASGLSPSRPQNEHIQHAIEAQKTKEFHAANLPLYHGIFAALYKNRNNPQAKKAKEFIQNSVLDDISMTLTRLKHYKELDVLTHNFGLDQSYIQKAKIVNPEEYKHDEDMCRNALFGVSGEKEINKVYLWLVGSDAYVWDLEGKFKETSEWATGFQTYSDWVHMVCFVDLEESLPSLDLRIRSP